MDATAGEAGPLLGDGEGGVVQRALIAARTHLGMEIAYASEFVGEETVFRTVDAPGLDHLIQVGDRRPVSEVYCRHILAGRLPQLMPDTGAEPLAAAMAVTRDTPIGAHVSVPLVLADGTVHGMFCCLSPSPDPTLTTRDLRMVRAFADMAAFDIDRELAGRADDARSRAAVSAVLVERRLSAVFQPIWSLSGERPVGFEALARVDRQPVRTPDRWFADAAAVGLGEALELAAVAEAIGGFAELPGGYIAVNVSPQVALGDALTAALTGAPAERLVLEITEQSAVTDYPLLAERLAGFRAAGVRIAVDDAGSGYAGLEQIVRLAPDILKLDRFLVDGIDADPARRSLAAALVRFARDTGATVVAEGVETLAELAVLRSLGVDCVQGFLLGRPAAVADARALMTGERGLRIA